MELVVVVVDDNDVVEEEVVVVVVWVWYRRQWGGYDVQLVTGRNTWVGVDDRW